VRFGGEPVQTRADAEGRWRVDLPAMAARSEGGALVIRSGGTERIFRDVLVGEVWFWLKFQIVPSGSERLNFVFKK